MPGLRTSLAFPSLLVPLLLVPVAHGEIVLDMAVQYDANTSNVIDDYSSSEDQTYTGGPQLLRSLGDGRVIANIDATTGTLKLAAGDGTAGNGGAVAVLTDAISVVGATSDTVTVTIRAAFDRALQLAASPVFPQDEGQVAASDAKFEIYPVGEPCHSLPDLCCSECQSGHTGQVVESRLRIVGPLGQDQNASPEHFFYYDGVWRTSSEEGPGFPPNSSALTDDIVLTEEIGKDDGLPIFVRMQVSASCGTTDSNCTWRADASHSAYLEITSSEGTVVSQNGYHYLGRSGGSGSTTTTTTTDSTTTTAAACTTARCILDAALHGEACASQTIPGKVGKKIAQAETAIESAATRPAKAAGRARRRARKLLAGASAGALHFTKGRHPKLSVPCAHAIQTAAGAVASGL